MTRQRVLDSALRLKRHSKVLGAYLTALVVCLVVVATLFDIGSNARQWPYAYRGDTMFYHLIAKSVVDHGWFLDVPLLAAPGTLDLRDVPTSDNNAHILLLRLLALGTSNYALALNNFFLLSFPLVFLSALWVLRRFDVTWWTAVPISLLYCFAPHHFLRGEHHPFLTAYWPVPLAVLVALWVSGDELDRDRTGHSIHRNPRFWLSVAIGAVLGATGFYYAFFATFFLMVAAAGGAVRCRSWRRLVPGLALTGVITVSLCLNLWPSIARFRAEGRVPMVQRVAADADVYGLRIAQLLLPVRGHRLPALDELRTAYTRRPLINENDDVSLGITGAVGFLALLWWFFFRKPAAEGLNEPGAAGLLHRLSVLNLAGVLFGTIGGFGSLVAFFGLPQVRGYNRISVFIAFFAFFAVALGADALARRYVVTRSRTLAWVCALAAATVVGLYDQITPSALPDYNAAKAQFANDSAFVQQVESNMPAGASIFQLPLAPFPEGPRISELRDYDLLRGYLHSNHLRWSYGTIRGRAGHAWAREIAALPPDRLVEALAWAGFSGIYIDRAGYPDSGARLESQLSAILRVTPLVSADGNLLFYGLREFQAQLELQVGPNERAARRHAALNLPLAVWRDGFSDEADALDSWRWGGSSARMTLVNRAAHPQEVHVAMTVVPNPGGTVTLESDLFESPVRVERHRPKIEKLLLLPPGEHDIRFVSDAPPVYPPDDFRDLVFLVQDFSLSPARTHGAISASASPSGE